MSYSYLGTVRENEHLFQLKDSNRDGPDFALWLSRQLIYRHRLGFSYDAKAFPTIFKPGHNNSTYYYEYPVVLEKAWLDRRAIQKDLKWYYCGSVHHHFINGFFGGIFGGTFNKIFTSWPVTNIIYPPKNVKSPEPDEYAMRQISQWTMNGIVRTFRVLSFSLAAAVVYDFSEQIFRQFRNKDDIVNPILSGAVTGGLIGLRRSFSKCGSTALLFAFFAASYEQIDRQNSKLNEDSFPNRNSSFFF